METIYGKKDKDSNYYWIWQKLRGKEESIKDRENDTQRLWKQDHKNSIKQMKTLYQVQIEIIFIYFK